MRTFFKGVAFVLIAAVSGTIGSYVLVDHKFKNIESFKQTTNEKDKNRNIITTSSQTWGDTINKVAKEVGPSVVGVSNHAENFYGSQLKGSGSGIIFDKNGYIVTNYHVIEGASKITVKLSNGKTYDAKLIGSDPRTDLAVIKIDGSNFPAAKFGDSSKVKVGDIAIAIGNPLGDEFAGSVTSGIISAVNRKMTVGEAEYKVLQTDAAINPGNSGGALCNENGEIIGINSLKIGTNKNAEGMGFAITMNSAKGIIDSLMKYGQVARPELGITGASVESRDGKIKGVGIQSVIPGSGAEKAGLSSGDVILEFDDKKISSVEEIRSTIEKHKIGDKINCKIYRNGKTKNIKIQLSDSSKINSTENQIG
ncbi:S1C family serine protease [Haloimpatiens sp. FM7330]|uniref:S1C family serine protease n=1 Tax=Haloimpatiens sp. FM7330 TaxID=3298610 RepID=UPI00363011AD